MKKFIKILKIGLMSLLIINSSGYIEILYALDWTDHLRRQEIRKQRILNSGSTIIRKFSDKNKAIIKDSIRLDWTEPFIPKIITADFIEVRDDIIQKKESWEITIEESRKLITQERNNLEDKVIINDRTNDLDFQNRKKYALKKRKWENVIARNKRIENRKNQIKSLRIWFEEYKVWILEKVQSWDYTRKNAKILLLEYREKNIKNQKDQFKKERKMEKSQQLSRVNNLISQQLSTQLDKYDSYSVFQKIEVYNNILTKIDLKLKSTNLIEKDILLLNLIKSIIAKKKNNVN